MSASRPNLDEILADFVARQGTDAEVSPSALLDMYPEHATALRAQLETLLALDDTFSKLRKDQFSKPPPALGRFQLIRELGFGGVGTVYLAKDPTLGRDVAIKILRSLRFGDSQSFERFQRESMAVAKLDHPNIIRVFDVGEDQSLQYVVMEAIDGYPLSTLLTHLQRLSDQARNTNLAQHSLPPDISFPPDSAFRSCTHYAAFVAQLGLTIARALAYAHDQGILHRDLKPGNVMLSRTGRVVVFDFGLGHDMHSQRLTHTGQVLGTPFYMAPEQFLGKSTPLSPAIDVYGLGITLYEMLTFSLPYATDSPSEVLRGKELAQLRFPPSVPPALRVIVARASDPNPKLRTPSMTALADDLSAYLEGKPISSQAIPWPYRLGRWLKRHTPALIGATVLVGCACAVVLGVHVKQAQREKQSHEAMVAALEKVQLHQPEAAQELAAQASQLSPTNSRAWLLQIEQATDPKAQRDLIDKALKHSPKDAALHLAMARWLETHEGIEAALAYLKDLRQRFPKVPNYAFAHATALIRAGKEMEETKALFETWLEQGVHLEWAHFGLGRWCMRMENATCMKEHYFKSLALAQDVPGQAQLMVEDFLSIDYAHTALELLKQALKGAFDNPVLHYIGTQIAQRLKDPHALLQFAQNLSTIHPNKAYGHAMQGVAHSWQDRYAAAIPAFARAFKLGGRDPKWQDMYLRALYAQGQYDTLLQHLEHVASTGSEKNPEGDAQLAYWKAAVALAKGETQPEQAETALHNYPPLTSSQSYRDRKAFWERLRTNSGSDVTRFLLVYGKRLKFPFTKSRIMLAPHIEITHNAWREKQRLRFESKPMAPTDPLAKLRLTVAYIPKDPSSQQDVSKQTNALLLELGYQSPDIHALNTPLAPLQRAPGYTPPKGFNTAGWLTLWQDEVSHLIFIGECVGTPEGCALVQKELKAMMDSLGPA